ncbi:hypothetical protein [Vibrio sonorensis]|uniref:hypothetical protein n=1 Tax=Vibrio sonorensis TaxID=1004316 RepID=UPI0008DA5532|nr:hypothetical protein [Vibrio sonorensis]
MSGDENIVSFNGARSSVQVEETNYEQKRRCAHRNLTLLEARRMVCCNDCGLTVDGFDWLMMYHKGEITLRNNSKHLQQEREHLFKQVEELKRERKNLKAAIRRNKANASKL